LFEKVYGGTVSNATVTNVTGTDVTIGWDGSITFYTNPYAQSNFKKLGVEYVTAAPASGTYYKGHIVYNNAPASAGYIGWVCVTDGAPGTWKTFGLIS
jgi:hypothetical protein